MDFEVLVGALVPHDLEHRFVLHYGEGPSMPPLFMELILDKLRVAPMPFFEAADWQWATGEVSPAEARLLEILDSARLS